MNEQSGTAQQLLELEPQLTEHIASCLNLTLTTEEKAQLRQPLIKKGSTLLEYGRGDVKGGQKPLDALALLRVESDSPKLRENAVWHYLNEEQTAMATALARESTVRFPEDISLHYALFNSLLNAGDRAAADAELATMRLTFPASYLLQEAQCQLFNSQKEQDALVKQAESLTALNPNSAISWSWLHRAYKRRAYSTRGGRFISRLSKAEADSLWG